MVSASLFLPGGSGIGTHIAQGFTFHLSPEGSGGSSAYPASRGGVGFVHTHLVFLDFFKVPETRF